VVFLHQASGLFIASRCRRDNYRRELKKWKWRASNAVKARIVSLWKSQTGQWAGMQWYVSQNSGAGFEIIEGDPTLYSRRGGYLDIFSSTFLATKTSFDASLGSNKFLRRNLSRSGNNCVLLKILSKEHASHS
jgi:hypothetical protein